MSNLQHNEQERLLNNTHPVRVVPSQERSTNEDLRFCSKFKWVYAVLVVVFVFVARLVGLCMFTVWAFDCFFREFHTPVRCEHFVRFPGPEIFGSVWVSLCAATSTFFILYVSFLSHFPRLNVVLPHLVKKKYFWKIIVILLLALIYDLLAILHSSGTSVKIVYVLFMVEELLAVTLVLFLNFLPSVRGDPSQNRCTLVIYKLALVLYALEGYIMALFGTAIALDRVLNVSEISDKGYSTKNPPGKEVVLCVMLLMFKNTLRYYLGDFFSSKWFDQDTDILGGGTKSISESLTLNTADDIPTGDAAPETQESSAHVEEHV